MKNQNKVFTPLLYLAFVVFLPWWIYFLLNKCLGSWITNWWTTRQSESFLNNINEKSLLEKFIEFEEFLLLDEIVKKDVETHPQEFIIGIHKQAIQLIKIQNNSDIHLIFRLATNLICFFILSVSAISRNENLSILNSWAREFLYNLSDTIKVFCILLLTDLCIGFHSPRGWEFIITFISKDLVFCDNDLIISGLVCTFPVILDTIFKYWVFRYLNRVSPSLVVLYHSLNE
uniref:Chloroplast envelope membrane protein n=1 Tax=Cuscuta approximata TaxID=184478 RepID=A0A7H0DGV2_9ASTE|nr:chloroplast envelope membrane protein [Cuscuta approximata]QNP08562.1 chloroplast envelope membrane protein [Cuscuta approximata]